MAVSTIQANVKYESGTLATYTWGTVTYMLDKVNKICYIRLTGNNNATPNSATTITVPDGLETKIPMLIPLYKGLYMGIANTSLNINTAGENWCSGSLVYPTV